MGITLVTPPTAEPVSLSEAKAHCRIDTVESDGLLAGYILAARRFAEGYTQRAFVTQTWDYTIANTWPYQACGCGGVYRTQIELPLPPLQTVSTITYVDEAGATQTLAANQYTVLTDGPFGIIVPAYGVTWPAVRWQEHAITVRFVAGWTSATVPDDLRQALLLLIGHFNEYRETVVNGSVNEVPMTAEALLSFYRSIRL